MLKKLMVILSVFAFCLAGCTQKTIKGSGNQQTLTRGISEFHKINIAGNFELDVSVGKPQSLIVTTDDNLQPYIITEVKDKELRIYRDKDYRLQPTQLVKVSITIPALDKLESVGENIINITDLQNGKFTLKMEGAGKTSLAGNAKEVILKVIGAGQVVANTLQAEEAEVHLSGSGNVSVFATKTLKVKVAGVGKVQYFGEPRNVEQKITGNGTVIGIPNDVKKNPS